jgi:hypothetical protein
MTSSCAGGVPAHSMDARLNRHTSPVCLRLLAGRPLREMSNPGGLSWRERTGRGLRAPVTLPHRQQPEMGPAGAGGDAVSGQVDLPGWDFEPPCLSRCGVSRRKSCAASDGLGLASHQMAGYHIEKVRTTFGIPVDCDPVAAFAIGYPGDPNLLDERVRQREFNPRERNPISAFVFSGQWGLPAGL